jgi:hypothetical protein
MTFRRRDNSFAVLFFSGKCTLFLEKQVSALIFASLFLKITNFELYFKDKEKNLSLALHIYLSKT